MGTYLVLRLPGWAIIRRWALINFLGFQSGRLFEGGQLNE